METAQVQPRQARIEIAAAGDDEIDSRVSNSGLGVVRVGKRGCAALRHPLHLMRHGQRLRHTIDKPRMMGLRLRFHYATSEARTLFSSRQHPTLTGAESAPTGPVRK